MQISVSCVRLRVRNSYLFQITQQMLQLKQHIWIRLQFLKMSVRSVSLAVMTDGRTLWFKADSEERRPEMLILKP